MRAEHHAKPNLEPMAKSISPAAAPAPTHPAAALETIAQAASRCESFEWVLQGKRINMQPKTRKAGRRVPPAAIAAQRPVGFLRDGTYRNSHIGTARATECDQPAVRSQLAVVFMPQPTQPRPGTTVASNIGLLSCVLRDIGVHWLPVQAWCSVP